MERKDQIFEAGQQYLDAMDEFQRYHTYPREAFRDGAKWADEHPKPGTVDKQEFIDKAREILKNTIVDDVFANRGSVIKYMSVNEFVEYFCKAMEE